MNEQLHGSMEFYLNGKYLFNEANKAYLNGCLNNELRSTFRL